MSGPDERRGTDGGEHPLDVDARFADIVAHFHDGEPSRPEVVDDDDASDGARQVEDGTDGTDSPAVDSPVRDGPAPAADGPAPDGPAADAPARPGIITTPDRLPATAPARDAAVRDVTADLRAADAERAARVDAEIERAVHGSDGGHFVPADPPPIPRPDLPGRLAWTGVLLGPLLLLLCAAVAQSVDVPPWLVGSIVTGTVAGFGYLVWRLPRTRDRDDPDDGAIV